MRKIEDILEFDKVKELILKYNINELSRKKVNELHPLYFDEVVNESLIQTLEGYKLTNYPTFPSLTTIKDLKPSLDLLAINAMISLEEIYEFAYQLEVVSNLKRFLLNTKLDDKEFFYTCKYINSLDQLTSIYDEIKYCVTPNYTLFDHASSKLKSIRNEIRKTEAEIKEKLNNYLRNNSEMLSDNYIATRGTHFVLPVKASYKNQIKGLVIDVSNSSNTIFIEPYIVTEANIKLEQLHYDEELEISRIIKALCNLINGQYYAFMCNNDCLGELSFMLLKGQFGVNNKYEIASFNNNNEINIIGAKHPLIDKNKVVENDYYLGGNNNNIIVISGPNAGGKTVALKTIALLVLMNQCGLPLPITSGSLPVFRNIFVDIGDEQSILESLSGFTSNMKNIIEIMDNVDSHSLVVLDELGSKTDPTEGEALAKAIIDYLENSKAIAMITTHYIGIKDYAKENSSITLASMGFNEDTLDPTYHLLLNVVGRSYALEISSRLGLKKEIINKAKSYKSDKSVELEALIDDLSSKLSKQNEINENIKRKEKELNEKLKAIEDEKIALNNKYNEVLESVNQTKDEMIEDALKEINDIVNEFKNESESQGFKHHLKNNALNKLNALATNEIDLQENDESINVGDLVKNKNSGKEYKVKEIRGKNVTLFNGVNNVSLPISDVIKINSKPEVISKQAKKRIQIAEMDAISRNVPISLNLIGMHVDEATATLRNYLDAANMVRYERVTIIHGYGTGALRKAVADYLKTCKYVKSFELGGYNDGGAGATVVTLKR